MSLLPRQTFLMSMNATLGRALHLVWRRELVLLHDAALMVVVFWFLPFVLASPIEGYRVDESLMPLVLILPLCLACSVLLNLHNRSWRFLTLSDLTGLAAVASIAAIAFVGVYSPMLPARALVPATLLFWFLLLTALLVPRLLIRQCFGTGRSLGSERPRNVPILIVGADWIAESFLRYCRSAGDGVIAYSPVGILVAPPAKRGRTIHSVPVLGAYDDLKVVVMGLRQRGIDVEQIVLSASRDEMTPSAHRALYHTAQSLGVRTTRLPKLTELEQASASIADLRPVSIGDLLGRPSIGLRRRMADRLIAGARVLVTGAGGTIGSELSRQISRLHPTELVLVDNSEYGLYRICLEIEEAGSGPIVTGAICDVRDPVSVSQVMTKHRPDLVFHAAALKHVPIVEAHPSEGVLTNVLGTCNVADATLACGCAFMMLISTDKAVDPTNVMGTTKRIAEAYCQSLDAAAIRGSRTRFSAVRFGNVAGSSGSVIPLFQRQINSGGPLTITHPNVRRFFMTIEEAVELVLSASNCRLESATGSGHVYVLDMGEPIRIVELGAQMARMAGLVPGRDIKIEFVGLRRGEKLDEVLFRQAETVVPTSVPGILAAASKPPSYPLLRSMIDELVVVARRHDQNEVRRLLVHLLSVCDAEPGFRPSRRPAAIPPPLLQSQLDLPALEGA